MPKYSDVQGLVTGSNPNKNINASPLFKGSGAGAGPWHISTSSPCNGKADPAAAPSVEHNLDLRSKTAPDIGSDEIP